MINVITQFGTSFKGLHNYCSHDIGSSDSSDSSDRVLATATHNMATDDVETGWRVMAATAMNQADLKEAAGIPKTGNKSKKHVMHYVLSWHPEERDELTPEHMFEAARASMSYLGTKEGEYLGKNNKTGKPIYAQRTQFADEHQANLYIHDDREGKSMHVHVELNRVHPEHGVMLPDHKDYARLSRWALEYRQAQGKEHYCPKRVINDAKRAQGLKTSDKRVSRPAYEQNKAIEEADPDSRKKALLEEQKRRTQALTKKGEELKKRQAEAVRAMEDRHLQGVQKTKDEASEKIKSATSTIRAEYGPKIEALSSSHRDEMKVFDEAKGTAAGHALNAWTALQTKEWMREIRTNPLQATTHAFKLAFDAGLQQRDIKKHQDGEVQKLTNERTGLERDTTREMRQEERGSLTELRDQYRVERADLQLQQAMETAKHKAEWNQLMRDREAAMAEGTHAPNTKPSDPSGRDAEMGSRTQQVADTLQQSMAEEATPKAPPVDMRTDAVLAELEAAQKIQQMQKAQEQDNSPEQGGD